MADIETYRIKYKEYNCNLTINKDHLLEVAREAVEVLHRAKPLFPYGRSAKIDGLAYNGRSFAITFGRKLEARGTGVWLEFEKLGEIIPSFKSFVVTRKVFPDELNEREIVILQKEIISQVWDAVKPMINGTKTPGGIDDSWVEYWKRIGEYND